MNISEFAGSRNVEAQAVSRYIIRHKEEFETLVTKEGKNVVLSEIAIEKLDKVYPLPKPLEVIIDHESRDQLIIAQAEIIKLQRQLSEQATLIAEAKYHQSLLDQREEELALKKEELTQMEEQVSVRDGLLQQKDNEIRKLQEQLNQMEKAGLFSRIFKKW